MNHSENPKVRTIDTIVVGIKYHRGHTNGLVVGEAARLLREPSNKYDPNAVRVEVRNCEVLGYIPSETAPQIADELDRECSVDAYIAYVSAKAVHLTVAIGSGDSDLPSTIADKEQCGFESLQALWAESGGDDFKNQSSGNRNAFYRSPYWQAVKKQVLLRDNKVCQRCGSYATHVHHLDYWYIGVDHRHPEMLVSLCQSCHPLMEYGRDAESLLSSIQRRLPALVPAIASENASKLNNLLHHTKRLLENREILNHIRHHWTEKIPHHERKRKSWRYGVPQASDENGVEAAALRWLDSAGASQHEQFVRLLAEWKDLNSECEALVGEILGPIKPAFVRFRENANAREQVSPNSHSLPDQEPS